MSFLYLPLPTEPLVLFWATSLLPLMALSRIISPSLLCLFLQSSAFLPTGWHMLSLFLLSSSSIPLSCDLIPLYFFYMTQLSSLTSHFVLVCWNSSLANMYGSWQDAGLSFLVLFRTHPCFLSINLSSPDVTLTTTPMFVILLLQLLLLLLLLLSIGSGTEIVALPQQSQQVSGLCCSLASVAWTPPYSYE